MERHSEEAAAPSAFTTAWLHMRYPFDAAARNQRVQAVALAHVAHQVPLRLLDLGAGLGANTRYYAPILAGDQDWTLIEGDAALAAQCLSALTDWAAEQGWQCRDTAAGICLSTPGKAVTVRLLKASVEQLHDVVALDEIDVVMANALFDLFSVAQFQALADTLAAWRLPLLATLNYTAMAFAPLDAPAERFIRLYEQHMTREQEWGRAMGPGCAAHMRTVLTALGYRIEQGASIWTVSEVDGAMLQAILGFMQTAIPELDASPHTLRALRTWREAKHHLMAQRRLRLRVDHIDLFAWLANA